MSRYLRRVLPSLVLASAVPAIPVIALFTAPRSHPPPAGDRPAARALAPSADEPRNPARYLELHDGGILLRPAGPLWRP